MKTHFILYVSDQAAATQFYSRILDSEPILNVPGMTEFGLSPQSVLGLMPVSGIKRLLGDELPDPANVKGARAELYLLSEDPEAYCKRAIEAGARLMSPLQKRDWGHTAAYFLDPDLNVIAFAATM